MGSRLLKFLYSNGKGAAAKSSGPGGRVLTIARPAEKPGAIGRSTDSEILDHLKSGTEKLIDTLFPSE